MPPPGRAQQQRVVEPSMPFTPWPPQEIVNFYYSGLNIECSQEDIVKPTQTFVMQFYGRILEDAWKINSESAAEHRSVYLNMLAYGRVGSELVLLIRPRTLIVKHVDIRWAGAL
jgi:hypothetical protein